MATQQVEKSVGDIRLIQNFYKTDLTRKRWEFYARDFLLKLDAYELSTILSKLERILNLN